MASQRSQSNFRSVPGISGDNHQAPLEHDTALDRIQSKDIRTLDDIDVLLAKRRRTRRAHVKIRRPFQFAGVVDPDSLTFKATYGQPPALPPAQSTQKQTAASLDNTEVEIEERILPATRKPLLLPDVVAALDSEIPLTSGAKTNDLKDESELTAAQRDLRRDIFYDTYLPRLEIHLTHARYRLRQFVGDILSQPHNSTKDTPEALHSTLTNDIFPFLRCRCACIGISTDDLIHTLTEEISRLRNDLALMINPWRHFVTRVAGIFHDFVTWISNILGKISALVMKNAVKRLLFGRYTPRSSRSDEGRYSLDARV